MIADNSAATIIWRATIIMVACFFIGLIFGGISQRAIDENIASYKEAHPIPLEDHEQDEVSEVEVINDDSQDEALPGAESFSESLPQELADAGTLAGGTPGDTPGNTQGDISGAGVGTLPGAGTVNT